mgnify:CR=1 FL=1
MKEVKKQKSITQTAKEILDLLYEKCSEKIPHGNLIRLEFENLLISYEASASSSYDKNLFNELMKICDNNEVLLFNALNFLFDKNFIKGIYGQTLDGNYNMSIDSLTSNAISLIEGYKLGIKQNETKFMLIFNIKEANLVKELNIIKVPLTIFGNCFKWIGNLFNHNKGEKRWAITKIRKTTIIQRKSWLPTPVIKTLKCLMTQTAKDTSEPPKKSSPPIAISHLSKTP